MIWSTISLALYLLLDLTEGNIYEHEQRQERLFKARSDNDWAAVWHAEAHSKCRENLARHLFWACEKDIYKLSKKSGNDHRAEKALYGVPTILKRNALSMLRLRRSPNGSITDECCSPRGCTWEEYAEYCPDNRRSTRKRFFP